MARKPIVAVTMGDPAGIGPEVVRKTLADPLSKEFAVPYLGDWEVLARAWKGKANSSKLVCWQPGQALLPLLESHCAGVVCSVSSLSARESRPGCPTKAGGHAAYRYIVVAAKLALSGVVDAMATAPISKSILQDAGYNYPGHTELLAELSRTPECRMMLIGKKLRVVLVTGHVAFTEVAGVSAVMELVRR
jgi:4-hydroxythreonine-4-phosphate dehydrogenase